MHRAPFLRHAAPAAGLLAAALLAAGSAGAAEIDPAAMVLAQRPRLNAGPQAPATGPALLPPAPAPSPPAPPILQPPQALVPAGPSPLSGDLGCLAAAIYYEAGNQSRAGQEAVAQVVLNRTRRAGYPKSVCGVVLQGAQRQTGCQFTFTCDGSLRRRPSAAGWRAAAQVAAAALEGRVASSVGDATNYHADYVRPYWSATLVRVGQIGAHIFYRPAGPGALAPGMSLPRLASADLAAIKPVPASASTQAPPPPTFLPWGLSLPAPPAAVATAW